MPGEWALFAGIKTAVETMPRRWRWGISAGVIIMGAWWLSSFFEAARHEFNSSLNDHVAAPGARGWRAGANKNAVGEHEYCGNMVCVPYRNKIWLKRFL
jgi:hypothetical protein